MKSRTIETTQIPSTLIMVGINNDKSMIEIRTTHAAKIIMPEIVLRAGYRNASE